MLNESDASTSSYFADSVSSVRFRRFLHAESGALSKGEGDLWELIYVDCGSLTASVQNRPLVLSQSTFLLQARNHGAASYTASGGEFPCAFIFTFSCAVPYLHLLSDRILTATKVDRLFLAGLLIGTASGDPLLNFHMERLLERLFSRFCLPALPFAAADNTRSLLCSLSDTDAQYLSILRYLKKHLRAHLSVERICRDNLISRSRLENLFHKNGWHGVIDCFSHMKIDAAKQMIASSNMTFSQISATLGYSSVHYFSRQFKKETKMTPTEYSCFLKEHSGDVIPSINRYYSIAGR